MKIEVVSEHSRLLKNSVPEIPGSLAISIGNRNILDKSQVNYLSALPDPILVHHLFTLLNYAPDLASLRLTSRRINDLIEASEAGRLARSALNKEPSSIRTWIFDHEIVFNRMGSVFSGVFLGVLVGISYALMLFANPNIGPSLFSCERSEINAIRAAISGGVIPTLFLLGCVYKNLLINPSFFGSVLAFSIAGSLSGSVNTTVAMCQGSYIINDTVSAIVGGSFYSVPFNLIATDLSIRAVRALDRYSIFNHDIVSKAHAEMKQIRDSISEPSSAVVDRLRDVQFP